MLDALIYLILPAILLVLGFPIFLALFVTCIVILLVAGLPTGGIQVYMFGSLDNFPLLAVPFFVLAGEIMAQGGVARRIIVWVISLIGGVRGSLGVTTVAASELFGAMTHTAVGTVVAVGRMTYPSLRENGYDERFAAGLIASSGAIAVVIPPSISMIIYSMVAQQSAIALFTAGILPSLLIGLVDAIYVMAYARTKGVPSGKAGNWRAIWAATKDASWSLGTIIVIFGGILRRHIYTDGSRRRRRHLFAIRHDGDSPRSQFRRSLAHHHQRGRADRSDHDHRDRGRHLRFAAHDQRHPPADRRQYQRAPFAGLGDAFVPEHHPPGDGQLSRAAGSHPDPDASSAPDRRSRRRPPHSLRHHHGREPEHRHVHPAIRVEPVRLAGGIRDAARNRRYRGVLPFVILNFITLLVITYVPAISTAFLGH